MAVALATVTRHTVAIGVFLVQFTYGKEDIFRRLLKVQHLMVRTDNLRPLATTGFHTPNTASLAIALAARVEGIEVSTLDHLFEEGIAVRTIGIRGTVRTILRSHWSLCNRSLFPVDERELSAMVPGAEPLLLPLGMASSEVLRLLLETMSQVVGTRVMTKTQLGKVVSESMMEQLSDSMKEIWSWPSPLFEGQTLGESLVRYLLPIASLSLPIALVQGKTGQGFLYRLEPRMDKDDEIHGTELVMRYLHEYGPGDVQSFAVWAGMDGMHAQRLWDGVSGEELEIVEWDDKLGWLLKDDVPVLEKCPTPEGLRLLGPSDPLLEIPDRSMLVHGKRLASYFFRSAGKPGMALYDGRCVSGWRLRRKGRECSILIEDIGEPLGRVAIDEFECEAQRISKALGAKCTGVSVIQV